MLKALNCGERMLRKNIYNIVKSRNIIIAPTCSCILQRNNFVSNYVDRIVDFRNKTDCRLRYVTKYSFSTAETQPGTLSKNEFENKCNETLDSLCDYIEEIIENSVHLKGCDVSYSDGVLTVHFGDEYGTYVINRQTPNHQIWLSSPTSGPKRYDFVISKNCWIYRHDNRLLHELLQEEIAKIAKTDVNFFNCANAG